MNEIKESQNGEEKVAAKMAAKMAALIANWRYLRVKTGI
jgi:hypothetical protein